MVAAVLASLSFVLRGFVGPHLFYHASQTLLDMSIPPQADLAASIPPNDWNQLRRLAAHEQVDPAAAGVMMAMVHSTVAFAMLAATMLPLGLAIGNGSRRFRQARRRHAALFMAATTTVLVYAAQVAAWVAAGTSGGATGPVIYVGFLVVPLAILLTLIWSGAAGMSSDELQKLGEPEAPR